MYGGWTLGFKGFLSEFGFLGFYSFPRVGTLGFDMSSQWDLD